MFCEPLMAVMEVLASDFGLSPWKSPASDNDFLRNIGSELDMEADEGKPAQSWRTS